jgi:hypothetical protein
VPLDYDDPTVGTASLYLVKYPHTTRKKQGTIFSNPGGPGASGSAYNYRTGAAHNVLTGGGYDVVRVASFSQTYRANHADTDSRSAGIPEASTFPHLERHVSNRCKTKLVGDQPFHCDTNSPQTFLDLR